jgi:AP2 domain/HNH endonuclease
MSENFKERYLLTRYNHDGLMGVLFKVSWQQIEPIRQRKWTSKLFSFSEYGSEGRAIVAAQAYRDKWLLDNPSIREEKLREDRFLINPPSNNTTGIIGVNRTLQTQRSGQKTAYWQASWSTQEGQKFNKSFSVGKFGENNALGLAIKARRDALLAKISNASPAEQAAIDFYSDILESLKDTPKNALNEVVDIAVSSSISTTEKYEKIKSRIGQQRFRREVMEFFNNQCAITASKLLLRASHIKPWALATDEDRLNPANGLALSPLYDAAFDAGLISFRDSGEIILSPPNLKGLLELGIKGTEKINLLSDEHTLFLNWHRQNLFKANFDA